MEGAATAGWPGQAAAIDIRGACKSFARQPVLQGIDLAVRAGESFGLVGINGAGKSTLIKAMLDFIHLDAGAISLFGVSAVTPVARAAIAFLPERFMPPHFVTGGDYLRYVARLQRVALDGRELAARCAALDFAPQALEQSVRHYSKGMVQKLGLVAALLGERRLLVLDEPLSGLDPRARARVKAQFQAHRERGRTLFFSTHLLDDVEVVCDRIGILHAGRMRFVGTPEACRSRYRAATLEQAFLRCTEAAEEQGTGAAGH